MTTLAAQSLAYGYERSRPVLRDVSVSAPTGLSILLGPNGAGKSTLLSLLAGWLDPWDGAVLLDGHVAGRRELHATVALVPQRTVAVAGLTAREQVALHAWTKGVSRARAWDRAGEALDRVGLAAHGSARSSRLSGGQLARVCLAQALSYDARALILDEPLAALDPLQRESFHHLLDSIAEQAVVVVSTHDVNDVTLRCDQVIVLGEGRPRFQGARDVFLALAGPAGSPLDAYRSAVGE